MMKTMALASILATLVTAGVAGATDKSKVESVISPFETSQSPGLTEVVLLPVDKDGNPYGKAGPWAFHFDLKNEPIQPPWILESMAQQVAAYMKQHPAAELRIDGAGEQPGNTAEGSGIRNRRISAIRTALINAGVPPESIRVGPR